METNVREIEVVSEYNLEKRTPMPEIKSLLKETYFWYKKNFKVIFNIFFIPTILMIPVAFFNLINNPKDGFYGLEMKSLAILLIVISIVQGILNMVAIIGFIQKIPTFKTITPHWIDVYRTGFFFFWAVISLALIQLIAVFPAFLFFILPGLILSFYFIFSTYALIIDEKRGIDALVHSIHIVRTNVFGVATRLIVFGFCLLLLLLFLSFFIENVTFFLPMFFSEFVAVTLNSFVQLTVLTPMIIIYFSRMYQALNDNAKEIEKDVEIKYKKRIKILMSLTAIFFTGFIIMILFK